MSYLKNAEGKPMKSIPYRIHGRLCRVSCRVHYDRNPRSATYGRHVRLAHVILSSGSGVTMPWRKLVQMECSGAATRIEEEVFR